MPGRLLAAVWQRGARAFRLVARVRPGKRAARLAAERTRWPRDIQGRFSYVVPFRPVAGDLNLLRRRRASAADKPSPARAHALTRCRVTLTVGAPCLEGHGPAARPQWPAVNASAQVDASGLVDAPGPRAAGRRSRRCTRTPGAALPTSRRSDTRRRASLQAPRHTAERGGVAVLGWPQRGREGARAIATPPQIVDSPRASRGPPLRLPAWSCILLNAAV
jgi:hypothetical protein